MAGQRKLTIVGLGLIGGSLGLAVRQARLGYQVVGHDLRPETGGKAKKLGAVDRAEWNLPAAVEGAELIVIATPPRAVESTLRDIAPYVQPGCVVTDVASVKGVVVGWADAILPLTVPFVGGHPMAGKETAGVESAEAGLLTGCTWCLCPGEHATQEAIDRVVELVTGLGARPFFVDPTEHDSYVAAVSHLPFLVSTALMKTVGDSPAWRDLAKVAASGFRDVSRLASGDPTMHADICLTNAESIGRWLEAFGAELTELATQIRGSDPQLEATFRSAKERRDLWLAQQQRRAIGTR